MCKKKASLESMLMKPVSEQEADVTVTVLPEN